MAQSLKEELTRRIMEDFLPKFNAGMRHVDMWTPDGAILPLFKEPVYSKEAIAENLSDVNAHIEPRVEELEVMEAEQMGDDFAYTAIRLYVKYKDGGSGWTKSLTIWKKVDGTWYFYRDMYSPCSK